MTNTEYLQSLYDQGKALWFNSTGMPTNRIGGCLGSLARVCFLSRTTTFKTDTPPTLEDYKTLLDTASTYTLSDDEAMAVQCIVDMLRR